MSDKLEETYTVDEFCNKFRTLSEQAKYALVDSVVVDKYVPYNEKIVACNNIIKNTFFIEDENTKNKKLYVNSPAEHMFRCLYLVKLYTKIQIDFKKCLDQFEALNCLGVFNIVFDKIPNRELQEFHMVLEMVESDTLRNEYETHAFVANQVERFGQLIGILAKPSLAQLSEMVQNIKKEDIQKIIAQLS